MKILFSRGDFSYDGENLHNGLIAFCHFNTEDTVKTVDFAIDEIKRRRQKVKNKPLFENVVLVPFSCLDVVTRTMDYDSANFLFMKLGKGVSGATMVPFSTTNKFHMDLPVNPYTKFISL